FLKGPMAFAGQMQLFSMLCLSLLVTGAYKHLPAGLSNRTTFALTTLANLSGLMFAGERSAWLGGVAAIVVIASCISIRMLVQAIAMLLVVGALAWFTVPLVHTRIESMLSGQQDVSTRVRFTVWNRAIQEWQSSPVIGIGILKFPHLDIPEAI